MKITRYELSTDRKGLLAYFKLQGKEHFYHIHSNELTKGQKAIRKKLLKEQG